MSKFHFPEENTLKTLVAQYVARRGAVFFIPIKFPSLSKCCHVARATLPFSKTKRSSSMVMIVGVRAGFSRLLQTGGVRTRWVSTRVEGRRQLSQPTIGGHRRVPVLQKSKRATCDQTDQRENHPKKDAREKRKRVRGLSW